MNMMMHVKETSKILLAAAVMVVSSFAMTVVAQETQPQKPAATKKTNGGGRDPFRKYEPPRPVSKLMAAAAYLQEDENVNRFLESFTIGSLQKSKSRKP